MEGNSILFFSLSCMSNTIKIWVNWMGGGVKDILYINKEMGM